MNSVVLTARVAEIGALRYTPAGLPALDAKLDHESSIEEAGQIRQVKVSVRAKALGMVAERLGGLPVGSVWRFTGFLAMPRNGKSVVLHIQEFEQD